jgi:hypothetical protein
MHPVPGPYRPPEPPPTVEPPVEATVEGGSGHPAVDAVIQALANAADLPPRDQIAEYEAAHSTLQETLATIDQA